MKYMDKNIQVVLYPITIPFRVSLWFVGMVWYLVTKDKRVQPSRAWKLIDENNPPFMGLTK